MRKAFNKKMATVFIDDKGHHRLMMPSGEVMPKEIKSHVVDGLEDHALVKVTAYVNLVGSQDEALAKYNGIED